MLASSYGLWKKSLWGWWLGLIGDFLVAGLMLWSILDEGWRNADNDEIALLMAALFPMLILLLPTVRKQCRTRAVVARTG